METRRAGKISKKDKGLLVSLAQKIGSTLGNVAARADVLSKPTRRHKATSKPRSRANKTHKRSKA